MIENDVYKKYGDIINLPHHVSTKRGHMSIHDRAAQFSPFAALTGHSEAINETGRYTDSKFLLDESKKNELDGKIKNILDRINDFPKIKVTYFVKDKYKDGGEYISKEVNVVKVDSYNRVIVTETGERIHFDDVYDIL